MESWSCRQEATRNERVFLGSAPEVTARGFESNGEPVPTSPFLVERRSEKEDEEEKTCL